MTPVRTWAALVLTYVAVVVSIRLLVSGRVMLDGPTVAALVAVPLVQALALTAIRRWWTRAS